MLEAFLEKIERMVKPERVAIKVFAVNEPVMPTLATAHTLGAVRDYLAANPDKLDMASIIVSVADPSHVTVQSAVFGPFAQRHNIMPVETTHDAFQFDKWMDVENFIIGLQASFTVTANVGEILKIVGNITESATRQHEDDGVSQRVTVKSGVTRVAEVAVPNPVKLAPYRTFIEVSQPESEFVLRVRAGQDGNKPTCKLVAADGGAWKIQAIQNVAAWLKGNLPDGVTIIA